MRQSARNNRAADGRSRILWFLVRRSFYHMQARSNEISAAFLLIPRLADVGTAAAVGSHRNRAARGKQSFGSVDSAIISLLLFRRCLVAHVATKNSILIIIHYQTPPRPRCTHFCGGERKKRNPLVINCLPIIVNIIIAFAFECAPLCSRAALIGHFSSPSRRRHCRPRSNPSRAISAERIEHM